MRYWLGYFKRWPNTAWVKRGNISHYLYILLQWSTCIQLVTTAVPGNRTGVCVGNEQIATICDSTSLVHCIMWETGLDSPEICFHLLIDNKVRPKGIYQSTRLLWIWLWAFPLKIWHSKAVRQNSLRSTWWLSKGNFHHHFHHHVRAGHSDLERDFSYKVNSVTPGKYFSPLLVCGMKLGQLCSQFCSSHSSEERKYGSTSELLTVGRRQEEKIQYLSRK